MPENKGMSLRGARASWPHVRVWPAKAMQHQCSDNADSVKNVAAGAGEEQKYPAREKGRQRMNGSQHQEHAAVQTTMLMRR